MPKSLLTTHDINTSAKHLLTIKQHINKQDKPITHLPHLLSVLTEDEKKELFYSLSNDIALSIQYNYILNSLSPDKSIQNLYKLLSDKQIMYSDEALLALLQIRFKFIVKEIDIYSTLSFLLTTIILKHPSMYSSVAHFFKKNPQIDTTASLTPALGSFDYSGHKIKLNSLAISNNLHSYIVRHILAHEFAHMVFTRNHDAQVNMQVQTQINNLQTEFPSVAVFNLINLLEDIRIETLMAKYFTLFNEFKSKHREICYSNEYNPPATSKVDALFQILSQARIDNPIDVQFDNTFIDKTKNLVAQVKNAESFKQVVDLCAEFLRQELQEYHQSKNNSQNGSEQSAQFDNNNNNNNSTSCECDSSSQQSDNDSTGNTTDDSKDKDEKEKEKDKDNSKDSNAEDGGDEEKQDDKQQDKQTESEQDSQESNQSKTENELAREELQNILSSDNNSSQQTSNGNEMSNLTTQQIMQELMNITESLNQDRKKLSNEIDNSIKEEIQSLSDLLSQHLHIHRGIAESINTRLVENPLENIFFSYKEPSAESMNIFHSYSLGKKDANDLLYTVKTHSSLHLTGKTVNTKKYLVLKYKEMHKLPISSDDYKIFDKLVTTVNNQPRCVLHCVIDCSGSISYSHASDMSRNIIAYLMGLHDAMRQYLDISFYLTKEHSGINYCYPITGEKYYHKTFLSKLKYISFDGSSEGLTAYFSQYANKLTDNDVLLIVTDANFVNQSDWEHIHQFKSTKKTKMTGMYAASQIDSYYFSYMKQAFGDDMFVFDTSFENLRQFCLPIVQHAITGIQSEYNTVFNGYTIYDYKKALSSRKIKI